MSIAAIVFGALALVCLVIVVVAASLRDDSKLWKFVDQKMLLTICLVLLVLFAVFAAYFCVNRCETCNCFVSKTYCEMCGTRNEKYEEPAPDAEKICPNCEVVVYTQFCGDCGAKIDDGER